MKSGHRPAFQSRFLLPRHWPVWLLVLCSGLLAVMPAPVRAGLADLLSPLVLRYASKRRRVALINLALCYPHQSADERSGLLARHARILVHTFLGYGQLLFRSPRHLRNLFDVHGMNIVKQTIQEGNNVILLTPHSLALEYAAQYLTIDHPMVCAVRVHSSNAVLDWLVSVFRSRYRGIIYDNTGSILGLVKQVRDGNWLYYLPDEDRGMRNAVFAPFYGIPKASLSVLGKLAKITRATVIPMTTTYCPDRRRFSISFQEPLGNFTGTDTAAEIMSQNQAIERIIDTDPAQYMWSAKIFRTRPAGESGFY